MYGSQLLWLLLRLPYIYVYSVVCHVWRRQQLRTLSHLPHKLSSCHRTTNRSSDHPEEYCFSIHCNSVRRLSRPLHAQPHATKATSTKTSSKYLSCNSRSGMKQGSPACCTMTSHGSDPPLRVTGLSEACCCTQNAQVVLLGRQQRLKTATAIAIAGRRPCGVTDRDQEPTNVAHVSHGSGARDLQG
jgi:hypothetical protein